DDAGELLFALDLGPAIVFGTSAATGIVASMCLRYPEVLRGAIFHEPLFPSGASNIDAVRAGRPALIAEGMAKGGPRVATELFLRNVAGDQVYDSRAIHCYATGCWTTQMSCLGSKWRPTSHTIPRPTSSKRSGFRRRDGRSCRPESEQPRPLAVRGSAMARRSARDLGRRTARWTHGLPRRTKGLRQGASTAPAYVDLDHRRS